MAKAKEYKALTFLMLGDTKKAPGDPITAKELEDAGQTDHIDKLISDGAIGRPDDDVNEAHAPVEIPVPETSDMHVVGDDSAAGEASEGGN